MFDKFFKVKCRGIECKGMGGGGMGLVKVKYRKKIKQGGERFHAPDEK